VGDNTFNVYRDQGAGFIEEMLKRKTGQHFWLQTRADLILRDEDLLDGFREAGVYQFMMGLEYHKESVLKDIRKRLSAEQARKAMELVKKHKMMVMATLLIGDSRSRNPTRPSGGRPGRSPARAPRAAGPVPSARPRRRHDTRVKAGPPRRHAVFPFPSRDCHPARVQ
jgi:hypothetical protein